MMRRMSRMRPRSLRAAVTPGTWAATSLTMAIVAALVHRTVSGEGQHIDASIHEACALTTESAIANYVYRNEILKRHTGRHHSPGPAPHTQFLAKDGRYVNALISGRLNPAYMKDLAA